MTVATASARFWVSVNSVFTVLIHRRVRCSLMFG